MSDKEAKRPRLDQLVEIAVSYQRSVNAESPTGSQLLLRGYVPTERSLDLLGRLVDATACRPGVRSWSVTGPYGSGKSSFIAFARALFGKDSDPAHRDALARLRDTSPVVCDELGEARKRAGVGKRGYLVAVATSNRESVETTIARALLTGAEEYWSTRGRKPDVLHQLRAWVREGSSGAVGLLNLLSSLEVHVPVLLAIDEFGKALEYAAQHPVSGDLYVLQLIAEHFNSAIETPSLLMTFQHLSISDYADSLPHAAKREWIKVEGRFEDVAFAGSFDQAAAIVRGHLRRSKEDAGFEDALRAWADSAARLAAVAGSRFLESFCSSANDTYPLHPLTLALAPSLSQRYGQGNRSLNAWLAGGETHSVSRFLAERSYIPGASLPVYGLDELFDYFLLQPSSAQKILRPESRLLEVLERVRESSGLGDLEAWLLRAVALFNLVGSPGELAPTRPILEFAAEVQGIAGPIEVAEAMASLERQGYVVYRQFAGEYRVWRGSDVDLEGELASARERFVNVDLVARLNEIAPSAARVAQRHGHQTGTFRFFRSMYALDSVDAAAIHLDGEADGLLILSFGDAGRTTLPAKVTSDGRPIVVCESPDVASLESAIGEVLALDFVASSGAVVSDAVARGEIRERQAMAASDLARRIQRCFDPNRDDLRWYAVGRPLTVAGTKGLSSLLSNVCDQVYRDRLPLKNEILNRVQLTSQGAKARRELMEHMVADAGEADLGIEGFGPERSMYASVLRELGLHGKVGAAEWRLKNPTAGSAATPVWAAIEAFVGATTDSADSLDRLFAVLMRPPFGVREPVIPVLILAYLLIHSDDVALYQDGTFEPAITAPLLERFVKAPDRFSVRKVLDGGARDLVLDALGRTLGRSGSNGNVRNAGLLSALRPAIATVRSLTEYSLHTKRVSERARRVRQAVLAAHQLDELLFVDLPQAVGQKSFDIASRASEERASEFAGQLLDALRELSASQGELLAHVETLLREAFGVRDGAHMRTNLRERARRMGGRVIDARLRSFILYASDEGLDDVSWFEALSLSLTDKPSSSWRDSDIEIFSTRLLELAGLFARVEYLCCAVDAEGRSDGFVARRIAVTQPDGREVSRVVWADESEIGELRAEADSVLKRLGGDYRGRKLDAFLAILADQVLSISGPVIATGAVDQEGDLTDADAQAG